MHVLVVGGTGMLGRRIVRELLDHDHQVTVSSRSAHPSGLPAGVEAVQWDTKSAFPMRESVDAIINVGGATIIGERWTDAYKEEMHRSRVGVNRLLAAWCREMQPPPRVFVSSNAVGYYGIAPAGPVTEDSPPGDDFLARLCVAWEAAAMEAATDGTRVASMRQGVVLDRDSDVLKKMLPPFKLGVGGKVGSGRQPLSWISSHDAARLFRHAIEEDGYRGPVNAVAPGHETNADLTQALGRVLGRPTFLPVPPAVLRVMYGEAANVMTEGQDVVPQRAKALGFAWEHPGLEGALRYALEEQPPPSAGPREATVTRSA